MVASQLTLTIEPPQCIEQNIQHSCKELLFHKVENCRKNFLNTRLFLLRKRKDVDVQDQNRAPCAAVCHTLPANCLQKPVKAAVAMSRTSCSFPGASNVNTSRPRYPAWVPGAARYTPRLAAHILLLVATSVHSNQNLHGLPSENQILG